MQEIGTVWYDNPKHYFIEYNLDYEPQEPKASMPDAEAVDMAQFDHYLHSKIALPDGEGIVQGIVHKRKFDGSGRPVGTASNILLLDMQVYQVEFPDRTSKECIANIIAEFIYL